jgi:hypothetical protein
MGIPKNKKLIKSAFFAIISVYLIYLFIYSRGSYALINNRDLIVNILWIIVGVLAGFIFFYSIWLKNNGLISKRRFVLNALIAFLLFVIFKGFPFAIAFIDFAINGW